MTPQGAITFQELIAGIPPRYIVGLAMAYVGFFAYTLASYLVARYPERCNAHPLAIRFATEWTLIYSLIILVWSFAGIGFYMKDHIQFI